MHLQKKFERRANELGADPDPTTFEGAEASGYTARDNAFATRMVSINGWPVARICVGYVGPKPSSEVEARLFAYDRESGLWFVVHDQTLRSRRLSWFDCPVIIEASRTSQTIQNAVIELALLAAPAGEPDEGVHAFHLGADLSSSL